MRPLVKDVPVDDFLAIIRGGRFDRDTDRGAVGVPGLLGRANPNETPGNWAREAIIKYGATNAEINNGTFQQAPLIAIEGAGRRPVAMTIDSSIVNARSSGTATYPAGRDSAGNLLSYRAALVVSAGVSYGQVGTRSDDILVDIGRRVTVAANILYVSVLALPPPPGYVAGSMQVGAMVGLFGALSQAPAVSTSYIDALPALGVSAPINLPNKAGELLPIQSSDTSGLVQLDFQDQAGQPVTSLLVAAGQMVAPLPCSSSDYYQVVVSNLSTTTAVSLRLPWGLSL